MLQLKPGCRAVTTDVCVPISRLANCVVETEQDLADASLPCPIVGHAGDGNFHVAILIDPEKPEELAQAEQINGRIVARALRMAAPAAANMASACTRWASARRARAEPSIQCARSSTRSIRTTWMNPGKIFSWVA